MIHSNMDGSQENYPEWKKSDTKYDFIYMKNLE